MPLITKVYTRLSGGQTNHLSMTERKVLVNSVINTLPLDFMQAFMVPKRVIKHLERLKQIFFWKEKEKCLGGHCLVN
jgi:hypothetical protein